MSANATYQLGGDGALVSQHFADKTDDGAHGRSQIMRYGVAERVELVVGKFQLGCSRVQAGDQAPPGDDATPVPQLSNWARAMIAQWWRPLAVYSC